MEQQREPVEAEKAFMAAVKATRKWRGWSQADLAERLHELGVPLGRGAVAKIESGVRALRWHEALALAAALGSDPTYLAGGGSEQPEIEVTPELILPSSVLRQWLIGNRRITIEDRVLDMPISDDEWIGRQKQYIAMVYRYAQDVVNAVGAGDDDALRNAIEALNAEGDRHRMFEEQHGVATSSGRRVIGNASGSFGFKRET